MEVSSVSLTLCPFCSLGSSQPWAEIIHKEDHGCNGHVADHVCYKHGADHVCNEHVQIIFPSFSDHFSTAMIYTMFTLCLILKSTRGRAEALCPSNRLASTGFSGL